MPSGNDTKLTPDEVIAVARKHTTSADDITAEQSRLKSHIETLTTTNSGQMMMRLREVHVEWDRLTTNIVGNLREMATTLDGVAQALRASDEGNAGGITL